MTDLELTERGIEQAKALRGRLNPADFGLALSSPRRRTLRTAELARRAGSPRACRAAGQVMARNPIPIVIPCHRVVAAAGPGGYGGGFALKARLLALESKVGHEAVAVRG